MSSPFRKREKERNVTKLFKLTTVLVLFSAIVFGQSTGKTRAYYIAADEVDWTTLPAA